VVNLEALTGWFAAHLSSFRLRDLIDILIVAFLIYEVIQFVRKSRAAQILKGILLLVVLMELSQFFDLSATSFLLTNTMQLGVMAVLVVFQPELRGALEQVGRRSLGMDFFSNHERREELEECVRAVSAACEEMSQHRVGALIVFERTTGLRDVIGRTPPTIMSGSAPVAANSPRTGHRSLPWSGCA